MARKGIVPWENNTGQLGTPDLLWQQICSKEIYGESLGGELAKNVVASISDGNSGLDVTYADGTSKSITVSKATTADTATTADSATTAENAATADTAAAADKLTTARTITLSGDATGSASFDGSDDVTIEVSVSGGSGGGGADYGGLSHNGIYRGKDLGTISSTSELEAFLTAHGVSTGEFTDLYIGDYFTIKDGTYNKVWEVAAFDQYYGSYNGNSGVYAKHHVVLIPKANLLSAQMNTSNTTANGYKGSAMNTTTIPAVVTNLTKVLGAHLLSRYEYLSSTVNTSTTSMAGGGMTGATTACSWTAVQACLPNEIEVYGTMVLSSSWCEAGTSNRQLPLFKFRAVNHNTGNSEYWWLRSVVSSSYFACVNCIGFAAYSSANNGYGVRPLICVG